MRKFWGRRDNDDKDDAEFHNDTDAGLPPVPRRPDTPPRRPRDERPGGGLPGGGLPGSDQPFKPPRLSRPGSRPDSSGLPGGLPGNRPGGGLPMSRPGGGLPLPGSDRPGRSAGRPGGLPGRSPRSRYERLKDMELDMSMIADPLPYLALLPQSAEDEQEATWVEGVRAAAEQMIPGEFVIEARDLEERFGEVLGQLPRLMNDPDATELIRMAKIAMAMTLSKLMGPHATIRVLRETTVPVALVLAGYLIARNDLLTEDPDLSDFDPDELV